MANDKEKVTGIQRVKKIKCVVWDLDNTLWDGIALEGESVSLRDGAAEIIKELDRRGILQSIASKNDPSVAMAKLHHFTISEYFLYPQINWNAKSTSIKTIAESLNIGIDTVAFIDDQPFEREEVKFVLPDVLGIDAANLNKLLLMPELNPDFITEDSQKRRLMYINDFERKKAEESFTGPQDEFLASLQTVFTIAPVGEGDLQRAAELTIRTNQLNTTGYTYSYEELNSFRKSKQHKLLIASLEDKFGAYGKIGLTLIECREDIWIIKLLLMSCRVMSRGVGAVLLNHIMNLAKTARVRLQADFIATDRNRLMYVTYKFAGFTEFAQDGDHIILENNLKQIQPLPEYMKIVIVE